MRRTRCTWRTVLAVILSIVLVVEGIPRLPVWAEEPQNLGAEAPQTADTLTEVDTNDSDSVAGNATAAQGGAALTASDEEGDAVYGATSEGASEDQADGEGDAVRESAGTEGAIGDLASQKTGSEDAEPVADPGVGDTGGGDSPEGVADGSDVSGGEDSDTTPETEEGQGRDAGADGEADQGTDERPVSGTEEDEGPAEDAQGSESGEAKQEGEGEDPATDADQVADEDESEDKDEGAADGEDATDGEGVADGEDADGQDEDAGEAGDSEAATSMGSRRATLEQTVDVGDGVWYEVSVSYDEAAHIPSGAELRAIVLPADEAADARGLKDRLCRLLEVGKADRLLGATYLDLAIETDGKAVELADDVDVTVRTNAIDAAQSPYVEVALGVGDGRDVGPDAHIVPRNLTDDEEDAVTTLGFATGDLGTLALARVATRQVVWNGTRMEVALLLPRHGVRVAAADAEAPELVEGTELLACYGMQVDPAPAYGTTLWLEAMPSGVRQQGDEELGGALVYLLPDYATDVAEDFLLCGPEGTQDLVELHAGAQRLLLAWDSGYRTTTLRMRDVVVRGMMPQGTQGTARDVSRHYEDAESLAAGLDGETAQLVEEGSLEVEALAAYDITLRAEGDEYQPDDEHPLTVAITSDAAEQAVQEGKSLQVWHVADDKSVEVIEDFELIGNTVVFEAPGFSEYLLVAASESDNMGLSPTFRIRAAAKTYARSSTINFVDEEKQPLMGTVTQNLTVSYTTTGAASDETNTIDMYEFISRLNPQIADDYDFSRVFVQLTATVQKDFRYIQVSDGSAIGQSAGIYRAYLYMTGIDENRSGQDYYGTWYQLDKGGDIDNIYIEYYHVAEARFNAVDTRGDPVEGATFALYVDPACHTPFEYKDQVVAAQSNKKGVVSFGKIPRGTYYMKETVIPEGYKKTTRLYTVVVDGETPIEDVVHEDDDGSVIISDILRMKLTKEWSDNRDHKDDYVVVEVYAQGEVVHTVRLDASNDWTTTLDGLDPNEAYMVSETCVMSGGTDVTHSWIPHIEYTEKDPHVEYYRADEFTKGRQYVILTTTSGGTRALTTSGGLKTTPLQTDESQSRIVGTVTDDMVWDVDTLTQDGIIALRNAATRQYLDQSSKWYLNSEYPVPLYVRHINEDGKIRFYHRANLNSAASYYLYVWYGPNKEGQVDRYKDNLSQAAVFDIYRKYNVRSVDVTITNKVTRYPIMIRNVDYPSGTALPGMTFDLYEESEYDEENPGTPLVESLTVGSDGYLRDADGQTQLELSAGAYLLCQTSDLEEQGYAPLKRPLRFVITRNGALRVPLDSQDLPGFAYSTSTVVGETTIPVLQVPHSSAVTLEVTLAVQGAYADLTRPFEFALSIPEGTSELHGSIDGTSLTLTAEHNTFALAHGQTLRLEDIPSSETYVLAQTSPLVSASHDGGEAYQTHAEAAPGEGSTSSVTVSVQEEDARVVVLSDLCGTADDPVRVQVTNVLPDASAPATGVADNVVVWGVVALVCGGLILAIRLRRLW